jgi:acyl-CoA hydrolase
MEPHPASHSFVSMTEMVLPSHTNALGSIFGGVIMSWIDICAAISAGRHSARPVVTASIDDLHFVAPVHTGDIVQLHARVSFVHKTSMEICVRVDGENLVQRKKFHVASAFLTFVALGADGKPCPVGELILETDEDRRFHQEATQRREFRLKRRSVGLV